ncbi:MAG: AAA family ATPase [Bryobacteraceae bacterium]
MPIRELSVAGYRSIREMRLKLGAVNVLTGPNGCGKSNLYNAVLLLARAATGGFARALAEEGGMPSVLWAGGRKRLRSKPEPVRVILSVTLDVFGYRLECGLPHCGPPTERPSSFRFDPEVKEEAVWLADPTARPTVLMDRKGPSASIRDVGGRMTSYPLALYSSESVLAQIQEPHLYPELSSLRDQMRGWRFYHHFRTDPGSPMRHPQTGVLTPVLAHDGADMAAAIQTIVEIGDAEGLREAVDRAFPGARLEIEADAARFRVLMHMPGVLRPFEAAEFSDGTLRYLCLLAALLSPRPPALLALNEPETSIHPDLLAPLAELIARAARRSQLWITTHSRDLAAGIERFSGQPPVRLRLSNGETIIEQESDRHGTRAAG